MGTDNLHHKRRQKKSFDRNQTILSPLPRLLILCEDKVSCPEYLEKLKQHFQLSTAKIKVVGTGCDPSKIIEEGIKYLKKDDDFNHIYFVFDRDSHENYSSAISRIYDLDKKGSKYKKYSPQAITSIPCFELWLLLHFKDSSKPYSTPYSPCDELINDLKKIPLFADYDKGNFFKSESNFCDVIKHTDTAIKNSKKLLKTVINKKHFDNPHTYIHNLVLKLQEISEMNR